MVCNALLIHYPVEVPLFITAHDWSCNHLASLLLYCHLFRSEVMWRLHLGTGLKPVMFNVNQLLIVLGWQLPFRLDAFELLFELSSLMVTVSTFILVMTG